MASAMSMRISGIDGIKKAFAALPDALQKTAIRDSMLDEAKVNFAEPAAAMAPIGFTRSLSESFVVTAKITNSQKPYSKKGGRDVIRIFVGPSYSKTSAEYAPHAHLVEWGTGPRYKDDGSYTGYMPAQPFMRPAYDSGRAGYATGFGSRIVVHVTEAVAKVAKRAARGK